MSHNGNGNVAYLNQRRTLEEIALVIPRFGQAIGELMARIQNVEQCLDALCETVRREACSQIAADEFLRRVGAVRMEIVAAGSIAAAFQWIAREVAVTQQQREAILRGAS